MFGNRGYDFDFSDIQGAATIAVLSDTHGRLTAEAFRTVADQNPDIIVHAGDICGDDILPRLEMLAPVVAVLGNNDFSGEYGPDVRRRATFEVLGIDFDVMHIWRPGAAPLACVQICGHTHIPSVDRYGDTIVVNPGSVSRPRTKEGPTIARLDLEPNYVRAARIVAVKE